MTLTLEAADAYCRILTHRHYENFSVASRFVDARKRRDLTRIYAFCRTTDDLGDESPDATAPARLERWCGEVEALFAGTPPVHPVLVALQPTVEANAIPAQPFLDLIAANVQDQYVTHYRSWDELIGYCRLSAAPVGRMVLRVFGVTGADAERLSDDVCIGLQLANHAQDVSRDAAIGRRYLVDSRCGRKGNCGRRASHGGTGSRPARFGNRVGTARSAGAARAARTLPNGRLGHMRRDRGNRVRNGT